MLQVLENDGLPTNICHGCLINTELFATFRENVHRCERKLRDFVQTLAEQSEDLMNSEIQRSRIASDQPSETDESNTNDIIVIDPMKCYESSDEDGDDDDDDNSSKAHDTSGEQVNYEILASMYNRLALPESEQNLIQLPNSTKKSQNISIDSSDAFRNVSFCKYCEAAFSEREQCEAHEMNNHDPITPYVCNFCPFRCDTRFNVISHIKQFHEPEKPYICVQCNKHFSRRADLKKHAICHTNIRPFDCTICGKAFSRKTNLTKHLKVHSSTKPYSCKQCSRSFNNNNDLMRHEQSHAESSKSHQCSVCGAGFSRRDSLVQHQRKHGHNNKTSQSMPFNDVNSIYPQQSTQYSMQSTKPKPSINDHAHDNVVYSKCTISTESNSMKIPKLKLRLTKPIQKRFDCDKCTKTFTTMSSLKNHKRVHSGPQPLRTIYCTICNQTFSTKRELIQHKRTHSSRKNPAALPESAFLPENLKRGSHMYGADNKATTSATTTAATPTLLQQQTNKSEPFWSTSNNSDAFRPQFYAEYDLSNT